MEKHNYESTVKIISINTKPSVSFRTTKSGKQVITGSIDRLLFNIELLCTLDEDHNFKVMDTIMLIGRFFCITQVRNRQIYIKNVDCYTENMLSLTTEKLHTITFLGRVIYCG